MLSKQIICTGKQLDLYFLTADGRCTAAEGLTEYVESRKNPVDAAQDIIEMLRYIAHHGTGTPKRYLERMINRDRVWAVRKARFRMYGFMVGREFYLCTHDECRRQRGANQRLLDRTEALLREWEGLHRNGQD